MCLLSVIIIGSFTMRLKQALIMRFVIPVVFYEITNVGSVYWSDTAVFIGRI